MPRETQEFLTADAALSAAEGHYPVDVLLQKKGRKDASSTYVANDADFRIRLAEREFDPAHDRVLIWLPVLLGSDMLGAS